MDFKINARSNFSDIVKKCKNCGCTLVIKNSRDMVTLLKNIPIWLRRK